MSLRIFVLTTLLIGISFLQGCGEKNDCDTVSSKLKTVEKNFYDAAQFAQSDADKSCRLWRKNLEILNSITIEKAEEQCPNFKRDQGFIIISNAIGSTTGFMKSKRCNFD